MVPAKRDRGGISLLNRNFFFFPLSGLSPKVFLVGFFSVLFWPFRVTLASLFRTFPLFFFP